MGNQAPTAGCCVAEEGKASGHQAAGEQIVRPPGRRASTLAIPIMGPNVFEDDRAAMLYRNKDMSERLLRAHLSMSKQLQQHQELIDVLLKQVNGGTLKEAVSEEVLRQVQEQQKVIRNLHDLLEQPRDRVSSLLDGPSSSGIVTISEATDERSGPTGNHVNRGVRDTCLPPLVMPSPWMPPPPGVDLAVWGKHCLSLGEQQQANRMTFI